MVDEESQQTVSQPPGGAPSNRDRRPNETVIEGEVAQPAAETLATEAQSEGNTVSEEASESAPAHEPAQPLPPQAKPYGAGRALAAGALGGAVVAALAAAGLYFYAPNAGLTEAEQNRLAAVETETSRDGAAIGDLDKRLGALEGARTAAALVAVEKRVGALEANAATSGADGLDKRIGVLEAANAAGAGKIDADAQAVQSFSGDIKTLRADVDTARGEIPALAARVAKLESSLSSADVAALGSRVGNLESALAGPKAETRVAPENPSASDSPVAIALLADAIRDKLASGASYATELAALGALGVDPAKLAPLKALAGGAPTNSALAASFAAVEPQVLAAAAPKETGGIGERLLSHFRGLVQIRDLGEAEGDDPPALASQVLAGLRRGDLAGALAAFAKLPEPSRQAASGWGAEAERKQAAVAAMQAIREAAVARLAQGANP
jgi:hypothetical protein